MKNSFDLFDISLEISARQFHNVKNIHTQKVASLGQGQEPFTQGEDGKCNDTQCIQTVL